MCAPRREEPDPACPHPEWFEVVGLPSQCREAPQTSAGRDARSTRWLRAPVGTDGDYVPAPLTKLVAQKQGALGMFRGKFRSRLSKQLLALVTAAVRAADQSARIRKSGSVALSVGLCPIFCWCGDWCRG